MRVKILEEQIQSYGYRAFKDDQLTVPDHVGEHWCKHGWAEDLAGAIPTGERIPGPSRIPHPDAQPGQVTLEG